MKKMVDYRKTLSWITIFLQVKAQVISLDAAAEIMVSDGFSQEEAMEELVYIRRTLLKDKTAYPASDEIHLEKFLPETIPTIKIERMLEKNEWGGYKLAFIKVYKNNKLLIAMNCPDVTSLEYILDNLVNCKVKFKNSAIEKEYSPPPIKA